MRELIWRLWNEPETARKFLVALVGAVVVAASQGLLPPTVALWVSVIGPFITAGAVYQIRNKKEGEVNE